MAGNPLEVVILAAGKGTRMYAKRPKVLHALAHQSLVEHVLDTAEALGAARVHVVYGHGGDAVPEALAGRGVTLALQAEQLGTGHAVAQAMSGVDDGSTVLVLYGDVPLITADTLQPLVAAANRGALALLTAVLADAASYGRIVRDAAGQVQSIVERKDATDEQIKIREINTGFMAAPAKQFRAWLSRLSNDNAQGEYYLTDVVSMAAGEGVPVQAVIAADEDEIMGVNNKAELAHLERAYQHRQAAAFMAQGLMLRDPARFDVRGEFQFGQDVEIDVNVLIEGRVELGDDVRIGPNCLLRNVSIAAGTEILGNCVIEDATIGQACRVGPFARIRPETRIADHAHIGNFVEIKKSQIGNGSKVNHLAYIGDTTMGERVNVGAGAITCNYDGAYKHKTIIGDDVFVGSDCQLVAPVEIGAGATIGAGTTVTKDAPAGTLTISRSPQKSINGWQRPKKEK